MEEITDWKSYDDFIEEVKECSENEFNSIEKILKNTVRLKVKAGEWDESCVSKFDEFYKGKKEDIKRLSEEERKEALEKIATDAKNEISNTKSLEEVRQILDKAEDEKRKIINDEPATKEQYLQQRRDKLDSVMDKIWKGWKVYPTGFKHLDEWFGWKKTENETLPMGFFQGLYILAAYSGIGKTTFALQIADYMAKHNQHVLFFSGEMSVAEMVSKRISRMSKETAGSLDRNALTARMIKHVKETNNSEYQKRIEVLQKCLKGELTDEERGKAINDTLPEKERAEAIDSDDMYRYGDMTQYIDVIDDVRDVDDIVKKVEDHKKFLGASPVVFIDYLQILKIENSDQRERRLQIDEIMSKLRIMSAKHDIPVVVISALNRGAINDGKKKQRTNSTTEDSTASATQFISFSELKESSGIEYGADVVITLTIEGGKDSGKAESRRMKLQVIKDRDGQTHYTKEEYIEFTFYNRFNFFESKGSYSNINPNPDDKNGANGDVNKEGKKENGKNHKGKLRR